MTTKSAALLDSIRSLPLVTPRGRDDIAEAAETVRDAVVSWLEQDDCSESIEDARKRIEDALCDGDVLGDLFPDETEDESEMHGEAVGFALDMLEVAARRAEALVSMRVARSLRGQAALALAQLHCAAAILLDATDDELSCPAESDPLSQAREMERGLITLLDCYRRARGHQREVRAMLYQGLCVAQLVEDELRGREGAKALLGSPCQTHRGVRKLIREAQCALELPPPPQIPVRD